VADARDTVSAVCVAFGDEVQVDDDALRLIAGEHTREAGVRQLERAIARVLAKVTTALAADPSAALVHVTPLSYLKSHGHELGIDLAGLDRALHVHVPAGAIPKDGPSAGVTMVTALASLVSGRPVRSDVAMTGEVTLNGRVLPIGGVKQKLLAAHRAGLTTVLLPQRNEPDLDDVPEAVRELLDVRLVADVADLVREALTPATETAIAA
jgi:ATP-dependent Lon protease